MQPARPDVSIAALRRAFSEPRWQSYRLDGSSSDKDTLSRYLWNLALSAALQPAFHLLEVTLRNGLYGHSVSILSARTLNYHTVPCWLDAMPSLLTPKHEGDVAKAKLDLTRDKKDLSPDRLVASLGFGFWTGLFDSKYEHGRTDGPRLWPELAKRAFPYMERGSRHRRFLSGHFNELRRLRNRVAHHEPIWRQDVAASYQKICDALGWMNTSAKLIAHLADRHEVEALYHAGPGICVPLVEQVLAGDPT